MKIKDEVLKTIDAMKKAGFNPVDAVFEGAVGVKEDTTLAFLDKLDDNQMISGVVRVIYTADGDNVRFVEIPVGQAPAGAEGELPATPEGPPAAAPKRK